MVTLEFSVKQSMLNNDFVRLTAKLLDCMFKVFCIYNNDIKNWLLFMLGYIICFTNHRAAHKQIRIKIRHNLYSVRLYVINVRFYRFFFSSNMLLTECLIDEKGWYIHYFACMPILIKYLRSSWNRSRSRRKCWSEFKKCVNPLTTSMEVVKH